MFLLDFKDSLCLEKNKHQTLKSNLSVSFSAFKREYQKIGNSLTAIAEAFEMDSAEGEGFWSSYLITVNSQ